MDNNTKEQSEDSFMSLNEYIDHASMFEDCGFMTDNSRLFYKTWIDEHGRIIVIFDDNKNKCQNLNKDDWLFNLIFIVNSARFINSKSN